MPSLEENKALARRGFAEFVDKGSAGAVDELIAEDYRGHFSGMPLVEGREGFRQVVAFWHTGLSDISSTIEDIFAEGDRIAVRVRFTATHSGEFMGIPATGRTLTFSGLNILRIAEGKLAEQWVQNDDLALLQQLGAIPPVAVATGVAG